RYLTGEHEAVWDELARGALPEAEAVATETMRRVRRNLDTLAERLQAKGFEFDNPLLPEGEDADARHLAVRALPTANTARLLDEAMRLTGGLPLSVSAFYREVGAVNFSGFLDERLATVDDPLIVIPLEHFPTAWDEWQGDEEEPFSWVLAPDALHKDDYSG